MILATSTGWVLAGAGISLELSTVGNCVITQVCYTSSRGCSSSGAISTVTTIIWFRLEDTFQSWEVCPGSIAPSTLTELGAIYFLCILSTIASSSVRVQRFLVAGVACALLISALQHPAQGASIIRLIK